MPRIIDLDTALTDDQPRRYRTIAVDVESRELVACLYTSRRPTAGSIKRMLREAPLDPDGVILRQDFLSTDMIRLFGNMQFRSPSLADVRGVLERFHRELAEREADARTTTLTVTGGIRAYAQNAAALAQPGDHIVSPVPPKNGCRSGRDRELDELSTTCRHDRDLWQPLMRHRALLGALVAELQPPLPEELH